MKKRAKWIYIILFLVLIIVLVFYVMDRSGVQTPLSTINKQYCGDQTCQLNENHDNCCMDCGCLNNEVCIKNECQISMTTSTPPGITQTTTQMISESTPSGETGSSGETPSGTTEETTQTTSTTIYMGCSYNNCEACENKTACYNVGCVWCLSDRCLRICKGQMSIT